MSDELLVYHGAPTLAGLKTASLFTCPCACQKSLTDSLRHMNRRLQRKGLRVIPLRFSKNKALIYLYRPSQLCADLSDNIACAILRDNGYDPRCCQRCIAELARRLRGQAEFPHEIGLFLGYPSEDVLGFMENNARNCKCVGCWKVYGDEAAARRKFALYKKCARVYREQWAKGRDIERLTVAG